jgi:hypothetical protein
MSPRFVEMGDHVLGVEVFARLLILSPPADVLQRETWLPGG